MVVMNVFPGPLRPLAAELLAITFAYFREPQEAGTSQGLPELFGLGVVKLNHFLSIDGRSELAPVLRLRPANL
jgi:hypothetical protein